MDVKIAVITGAAFAGVLVAGALAAPRGGDDPQESAGGPTSIINTGGDGNFVLEPALARGDDDEEEWEDEDDEDDEHEEHERDHDDDDHEDDDDDHEDDD